MKYSAKEHTTEIVTPLIEKDSSQTLLKVCKVACVYVSIPSLLAMQSQLALRYGVMIALLSVTGSMMVAMASLLAIS